MNHILVYTVHKAGSMFIHRLTADVSARLDLDYHSINGPLYETIKMQTWKGYIDGIAVPSCFGPIRSGSGIDIFPETLKTCHVGLHLRDPRDVLVSLFYSHTFSHRKQQGGFDPSDTQRQSWEARGVDAFVIENSEMVRDQYLRLFNGLSNHPNVIEMRYEEMVSDFENWLPRFLSLFSSYASDPARLDAIRTELIAVYREEFTVSEEDVMAHKRQITPGDHRRKLTLETLATLNETLREVLERMGYE